MVCKVREHQILSENNQKNDMGKTKKKLHNHSQTNSFKSKIEVTDNNEKTATKYENLRYNTKDIGHGDWRIIICAPISS